MSKSVYGFCPQCKAPGKITEKRINGNTICEKGHTHPRAAFLYPTDGDSDSDGGVSENIKVSFLMSLQEDANLSKLIGVSHINVRNAFFANYVTSLLLLKLQDISGLLMINDHHHSMLTKFSSTMSDLNFWGRALFYSNDVEVKSRMKPEEAQILSKAASKISTARIQNIMKVPLSSPDSINWNEVIGSILLLQHVFDLKSSYFNAILRTLFKWDSMNVGAKQKAINDTLMFMIQSDPSSKIIQHLRKISNLVMINKIGSTAQRVVGFVKLKEDGEATSTSAVGTTNAILSPSGSYNSQTGLPDTTQNVQNSLGGLYKLSKLSPKQVTKKGRFTIRNGKMIKRKAKEFAPKRFKSPEFLKPKKQDNKGDSNVV